MTPILLIDFGSTYTKVTAIDLDGEQLLGTAASYTTVETDVTEGLANALTLLEAKTGPLVFAHRYACSSAAGGLRMMASGLVPQNLCLSADGRRRRGNCRDETGYFPLGRGNRRGQYRVHPPQRPGSGRHWRGISHRHRRKSHSCTAMPADSLRPRSPSVRKCHAQIRGAQH